MRIDQSTNRIAVFIDVENLVCEVNKTALPLRLRPIIDRIREEGQIVSMRAYGDWSQQYMGRFLSEFRSNLIEMIQLSTSTQGKNTADIQLAVEALEMVLQPVSPDMVVIVSGDRDFVPLVQKIKRYGKAVVGIGASEDSTSKLLAEGCDMFLFAYDIMQTTQGSQSPLTPVQDTTAAAKTAEVTEEPVILERVNRKLRKAFVVLAKAISACERQGQIASESVVGMRMRQITSTFYPGRYGFGTFREFASAAEKAGYAKITAEGDADGVIFDVRHYVAPELLHEELADYEYNTVESALDSYRDILKTYKKLELLSWSDRQKLVTRAWESLSESSKTFDELIGDLQLYAASNFSWVDARATELVVRTLSIARCFASEDGVPHFENASCHLRAAVELEEALFLMNYTYLNGIKMSVADVVFDIDAVAILLYDEATDQSKIEARKLLERLGISSEPQETSMGLALKKAGADQEPAETPSNEG